MRWDFKNIVEGNYLVGKCWVFANEKFLFNDDCLLYYLQLEDFQFVVN